MNKRLLVERALQVQRVDSLTEASSGPSYFVESSGGKIIVRLPATTLDVRNENGRIYSTQVMEAAIRRAENDFKSKKLLCTVDDHPSDPFVAPGNASHVVTRAWCENGYLMNEWEVLNTSKGRDLQALIDAKVSFGVSIRGLGSMDNHGNILEDYEYLGTDCVGNPSARIFTAPEIVSENANPNSAIHKGTSMKIDPKRYVSEQLTLMQSEPDLTKRFRRAAEVEATLAEALSGKSPKEIQDVMNVWDQGKDALLVLPERTVDKNESTATQLEAATRQIDGLRRQLNTLARVYREHLTTSINKHRDIIKAQREELKRLASESSQSRTEKRKMSRLERRVAQLESELKVSRARNVVLNLKYEMAVSEAAKNSAKCKLLAGKVEAATTALDIAVKEAARRTRKSVAAPKVESTPALRTRRAVTEGGRMVRVLETRQPLQKKSEKGAVVVRDQGIPGFL